MGEESLKSRLAGERRKDAPQLFADVKGARLIDRLVSPSRGFERVKAFSELSNSP